MSDDEIKNSEETQGTAEEAQQAEDNRTLEDILNTDDSELSEEEREAKQILQELHNRQRAGIFSIHTGDYETEETVAAPKVNSRVENGILIANAPGDPTVPTAVDLAQVTAVQKYPSENYPNTWIVVIKGGSLHIQLDSAMDLVAEWMQVRNANA